MTNRGNLTKPVHTEEEERDHFFVRKPEAAEARLIDHRKRGR